MFVSKNEDSSKTANRSRKEQHGIMCVAIFKKKNVVGEKASKSAYD